jgi:curved DNA-binding protein CbpA
MPRGDYYERLGVHRTATQEEIKSAFRSLAKRCHPDRHPGDPAAEAEFSRINEAYETLGDPKRRTQYDQQTQVLERAQKMVDATVQILGGIGDLLREFGFGGKHGRPEDTRRPRT